MTDSPRFQMRQCADERCRFRFPAPAMVADLPCPRCKGPALGVLPYPQRGLPAVARQPEPWLEALLDNIRSIYNVGAMLRTADGAGLRRLHLCGITATPEHPRVAKTALGSEDVVAWTAYANALDAADQLQAQGCELWALESAPQAGSLFDVDTLPAAPLALVVGNELAGVDPALLARCERVASAC